MSDTGTEKGIANAMTTAAGQIPSPRGALEAIKVLQRAGIGKPFNHIICFIKVYAGREECDASCLLEAIGVVENDAAQAAALAAVREMVSSDRVNVALDFIQRLSDKPWVQGLWNDAVHAATYKVHQSTETLAVLARGAVALNCPNYVIQASAHLVDREARGHAVRVVALEIGDLETEMPWLDVLKAA
jgi:hypothetical protein